MVMRHEGFGLGLGAWNMDHVFGLRVWGGVSSEVRP